MSRPILVLGCLGLLCLSGGRLRAEDPSRAGSDHKIDPDRQLVYNVEGLT